MPLSNSVLGNVFTLSQCYFQNSIFFNPSSLFFCCCCLVCQYACHVSCTDQAPPVCPIPPSQSKCFQQVVYFNRCRNILCISNFA